MSKRVGRAANASLEETCASCAHWRWPDGVNAGKGCQHPDVPEADKRMPILLGASRYRCIYIEAPADAEEAE